MNECSKERKLSVTEKERDDKSSKDKRRIVYLQAGLCLTGACSSRSGKSVVIVLRVIERGRAEAAGRLEDRLVGLEKVYAASVWQPTVETGWVVGGG